MLVLALHVEPLNITLQGEYGALMLVLLLMKLVEEPKVLPVSCISRVGVWPVTPAGQPLPSGRQPLKTFCWAIRNEARNPGWLTLIWLMS